MTNLATPPVGKTPDLFQDRTYAQVKPNLYQMANSIDFKRLPTTDTFLRIHLKMFGKSFSETTPSLANDIDDFKQNQLIFHRFRPMIFKQLILNLFDIVGETQ